MRTILLFISCFIVSCSLYASDCKEAYQQHLKTDLSYSYEQFDQTANQGFRTLSKVGCFKEAADLIEKYIEKNQATENSLRWHVAQLSALSGNYKRAIKSANLSLRENEDFAKKPLRWNNYVLATIAFLEGNKDELIKQRNEVAKGKDEYFGNELNLKLLDQLIKHFGRSYKFALNNK